MASGAGHQYGTKVPQSATTCAAFSARGTFFLLCDRLVFADLVSKAVSVEYCGDGAFPNESSYHRNHRHPQTSDFITPRFA